MCVRQKRSQITIFLVLGIVLVIVVVVFILTSNYSVKKSLRQEAINAKEIAFDVHPIKNFVDLCLNIVSKDSLENFDENYTEYEIESYVKNNIDTCLDFSMFEEQGFDISREEAAIDVSINENDVVFRMNYPIIITSPVSGKKTEMKDFLVKHKKIQEEV